MLAALAMGASMTLLIPQPPTRTADTNTNLVADLIGPPIVWLTQTDLLWRFQPVMDEGGILARPHGNDSRWSAA
jgi:hypothetical protein